MARQTLAHYEVGRARMPASMLPTVARLLTLSLDELMGQALPRAARGNSTTRSGKRGLIKAMPEGIYKDLTVLVERKKAQIRALVGERPAVPS